MKKFTLLLATILSVTSVAMCACGCSKTENRTPSTPSPGVTDDTDTGGGNTDTGTGTGTGDTGTGDTGTGDTGTGTGTGTGETETPKNTNTTVYYTNSLGWSSVYAFQWNYSTGTAKAPWPGTRLTASGTSQFGEQQFSVAVDYSVYDRIIFNNGSGAQTKDLVVSAATGGYYGEDGTFTMNENGGSVRYETLTDTKNLNYLPGSRKKISIYTPPGYSSSKTYGVLYMFDGQNLYKEATGADPTSDHHGSWAVDVAVSNLVKNGGDGVIIVGIETTGEIRDTELTMSLSFGAQTSLGDPQYGNFKNGKLDELGNFMRETLIPWVKANYSVDGSRAKTGIAGSSSGGLGAYYLGLRDNDIYGYIGTLSPANGIFVHDAWTRFYSGKNFDAGRPKIYVYCGQNDGGLEDMLLPETKKIKSSLTSTSYGFAADDITEYYANGEHNESYWRIVFQDFLGKMV